METYYNPEDLSKFSSVGENAPNLWKKFSAWYEEVFKGGALTEREKSLIALRAIYRGEEITVDYSIDAVDSWIMKCLCGNSNCRRTIYGDFRKLPEKLQDTYWLLVPRWKKRLLVRR